MLCGGIRIYLSANCISISAQLKSICAILEVTSLVFMAYIMFKQNYTKTITDRKFSAWEMLLFALLANYKIVYIYANNIFEVPFSLFLGILSIFIILFFCIQKITKFFLHSNQKSICTAIMLTFLMHFTVIQYSSIYIMNFLILDFAMFLALALTFCFCMNIINIERVLVFAKKLVIILLVMLFFSPAYDSIGYYSAMAGQPEETRINPSKKCNRDIYFILLDMYAGKDTLDSLGFKNDSFYESLRRKEFEVHENFTSNYNKTYFTIPSILNFDYLENVPMSNTSDAVDKSALFYLARKSGYKICYLNSWPGNFHLNPDYYYKLYVDSALTNQDVISAFLGESLFIDIWNRCPSKRISQVEITRESFISESINIKDKRLVFMHLLMPHWPYLCDENGKRPLSGDNDFSINKSGDALKELNQESYIAYLKYTNKYVLNLIDKILASSKTKPIIIIFGDHGVRKKYYTCGEEKHMKELLTDEDYLYTHFNTMLAYYNPDKNTNTAKTNTLVNFFRIFANETFGTEYKKLEDKKFYAYYDSPGTINKLNGFWVETAPNSE